MSDNATEQKILSAATDVFQTKGMDGARMQEIADKAGINKAMLHYYYRSKQKLFEAVFTGAIKLIVPKIVKIIDTDEHLFDKIRKFTGDYISFITAHSYIPLFIINELSRNPEIIKKVLANKVDSQIEQKLIDQINDLIEKGEIKPINPEQLLLDIVSLSIFPVMAKSLLSSILQKDDNAYQKLIEERKHYVAEFIINSIKK
jgi:AcrR family transcriptional regulator